MLDTVNISQATNRGNLSTVQAVALLEKQPQVEKAAAEPVNTQTENAVVQGQPVDQQPISPRLLPDSVSGTIITEFVGSRGEVVQQLPSKAALAYLRAGLTVTGENQPSSLEQFVADADKQKAVPVTVGQVQVA